jgi:8-oxo-dGTP pyrophosphatase MutT (NUDIX family)
MELLRTISEKEIYPDYDSKGGENKYRKAVRAIVFDDENKVALINVSKHDYYKLPGGGAESFESDQEALNRECLEEIGCKAKITQEVGRVFEHRDKINSDQESFCYIAKIDGAKGRPKLEPGELEDGFKALWVSIDEAIKLVKNSKPGPGTYDGRFIIVRDEIFLRKAKEIIKF